MQQLFREIIMVRATLVGFLFAVAVCSCAYAEFADDQHVLTLDRQLLPLAEQEFGKLFIMFTRPGCGYCEEAYPEFVNAAKALYHEDWRNVRFATIDTSNGGTKQYAYKFKVKRVPIFYFVHGDDVVKFKGERTEHDFVKFVHQMDEDTNEDYPFELEDSL